MRQSGFASIILILVLLIVVGVGAYYMGMKNRLAPVSNGSVIPVATITPSASSQPTNEFVIKELGIKFPTATITDFDYVFEQGSGNTSQYKYASFSTKTLETTGGQYCTKEKSPLGDVIALPLSPSQVEGGDASRATFIKQVGQNYIYYLHPQATCSDDKAVQEVAGKAMQELQEQLKQAVPIQ